MKKRLAAVIAAAFTLVLALGVMPAFAEPTSTDNFYKDQKNVWHVANLDGLKEFQAQASQLGGEDSNYASVVLDADIDLNNEAWTPIDGKYIDFDGNNKTVKNLTVTADQRKTGTEPGKDLGLFGQFSCSKIKNLTIEGATVTGIGRVAAVCGHALCTDITNCTVKNATVTATVQNKDNGDKAAAIVGYLSGESVAKVTGCSAQDCTITAYRDCGSIAGMANSTAEVTSNTASNITLVNDRTVNCEGYTKDSQFNFKEMVGRVADGATVKQTGATNVTIDVFPKAAKIGDKEYGSFESAFAEAKAGDTIVLLANVDVSETVAIEKALTIDLNGNNITGQNVRVFQVKAVGDLTLKNTGTSGPGTGTVKIEKSGPSSTTISTGTSVIRVGDNDQSGDAKLTIEANASVFSTYCFAISAFGTTNETVTINGGMVRSNLQDTIDFNGCALATNGSDETPANIVVNGGQLVSQYANGIYMPSGNLTVNAGEISGATGIYVKGGTTQIKGGTVTGTGEACDYSYYANGGKCTGDAVVVDNCAYPKPIDGVAITGGTLVSTNAKQVGAYYGSTAQAISDKITSTDNALTATAGYYWVPTDKAGEYKLSWPVKIGDTYYPSIGEAFAAAQNGETIELLCDCTGSGVYATVAMGAKAVTVDFGGHTYTMVDPAVGSPGTVSQAWHIEKGYVVLLQNGTIKTASEFTGKMLFQNYCNLALSDMVLDGTLGNDGAGMNYVLSNNCGGVIIEGNTSIFAADGKYAFDACWAPNNGYPEGTQVTVNTTGTISGKMMFDLWGTDVAGECKTTLAIQNGVFVNCGKVVVEIPDNMLDHKSNVSITGGTFAYDPANVTAAGYLPVVQGNGYFTVIKAELGTLTSGTYTLDPTAYVKTGYAVKQSADTKYWTVGLAGEDEATVRESTGVAIAEKAEISPADKAAIQKDISKVETSGVSEALTSDGKQEILDAAKLTDDQKNSSIVDIDITVKVEVTASALTGTDNQKLEFSAEPKATVYVDGTAQKSDIAVSNDYLNGDKITVTLPCAGIVPKQVIHESAKYPVEVFSKANEADKASYEKRTFAYDEAAGTVTVEITHFSTLQVLGSEAFVKVTFNKNAEKAEGSMDVQGVKVGTDTALTKNAFTRAGYEFAGWNTKADGSGTAYDNGATVNLAEDTTLYAQWKLVARVAGADRYETAAQAALKAYKSNDYAIVASGENFPDALCASGLAGLLGVEGCPIVLTRPGELPEAAASALEKLGVKQVYVVGGLAAVSSDVVAQIKAVGNGIAVERICGDDRYGTAEAIYEFGLSLGGWNSTAILATGANYPDALSISSYAFANLSPILLVDGDGNLTKASQNILANGRVDNALIVGGAAVVPASVNELAKSLTGTTPTRLAGDDRYGTSLAIAKELLSRKTEFTADGAVVATGKNFADALAGGPLAGSRDSIVLLADSADAVTFDALSDNAKSIDYITVLGGESAVPATVFDAALKAADLPKLS